MRPILFRIPFGEGALAVGSYSFFYLLAWVIGPAVGAWFAGRRGLPVRRVLIAYFGALIAGVVGARALDRFVAGEFYSQDPSRIWSLNFQGFSLYGGLIVACVAAVILARLVRLGVWRLADSAVPGIVTGIVLMRIGCFLRGCCFGTVTSMPWGVTYPAGSPAWVQHLQEGQTGFVAALTGSVQPVHPTQFYEMLAAVALGALALPLLRRNLPDGVAFLTFAGGFTAVRLANGFLRARQDVITAPEWFYPALYAAAIVVLGGLIVWRVAQERSSRRDTAAIYP